MTAEERLNEFIKIDEIKKREIQNCKNFVKTLDFNKFSDWLSTLSKSQVLLTMLEFSKDSSMKQELSLIEGYYANKFVRLS